MGRRNRARLERWAQRSIDQHGPAVAALMGMDGPLAPVTVRVAPGGGAPGSTDGLRITLSEAWFRAHPDDEGCVIHELSHAYLRAPVYDRTTAWLIEGIADHIRDQLDMEMPWTFAHFEAGKAAAGYQTTAHFLAWLEERRPGAVAGLCRRLADGTYEEGAFAEICERPLSGLISTYEAEMSQR